MGWRNCLNNMQKEAKARIKINELLRNTGWRFFNDKTGARNIEVEGNVNLESLGDDFEHGKGFIDYLLLDTKGFPLACYSHKELPTREFFVTKQ